LRRVAREWATASASVTRPWLGERREEWLDAVARWVSGTVRLVAPLEVVKERPWGAVLRARTAERALYVKAVGPGGRFELHLLADIAERSEGLAPDVVDVDLDAGWLLMVDHGTPVVEVADPAGQVAAVEALLPAYAEMQRTVVPLVDRWVAVGLPDRTPDRLPGLLERLLAGEGESGPVTLDSQEVARCRALLPVLVEACALLEGSGVASSVDHADVHGFNVLVGGGGPRLIDWGDACVTHPFSSLLVPIEWVVTELPGAAQASAVRRLVDAYLEPWGGAAADREVLGLAVWVGYVARALSNDHQCRGGSPEHVGAAHREIVALLRTWADKADLRERPTAMLQPQLAHGRGGG
jgi:hypothetical protein